MPSANLFRSPAPRHIAQATGHAAQPGDGPRFVDDAGLEADGNLGDDVDYGGGAALLSSRVFPTCMAVAGTMHVVHNMSWFADTGMRHFDDWVSQLKNIVTLLHYRHHRNRFLSNCVLTSQFAASAISFQAGVSEA